MCVILFVLIGKRIGPFQNIDMVGMSDVMLKSMTLAYCVAKS